MSKEQLKLRDEFAVAALPAMINAAVVTASLCVGRGKEFPAEKIKALFNHNDWAQNAYLAADAMLAERGKGKL